MKRTLSLLLTFVIAANLLVAQTADQGKKFLYYERYKSARETLEKILAANPNNIEAVYWLGQTMIEDKDSISAKNLYQRALSTNGNAPLLLAGMGQIELMEGKTNDARQRFEMAINLSKAKDVSVLNAVGLANVAARKGDPAYAIEKLNQATQVKGFKDPDTYIILGDAYRKLVEGGNAVVSYNKALTLDNRLAAAKNKIGRIYLTQNNPEYFLPAFEQAVQLDPAYAPAYYELFYYWYFRDVNKAAGYLDKFIANTDQGPQMEYLKTDFTYAKGDFAGAKTKAQELITQFGDKVNPRMYRMVAYTSDTLGDLQGAKQAMNTYLSKADPEEVRPEDYIELANINSKIPGSEGEAFTNLQMAVNKDTLAENKIKYIVRAAGLAKKLGNRKEEANWLGIAYKLDKNPTQTDLYNWGMAHYQAANYQTADSIFCNVYESMYPNEIYGYLWCARSKQALDTTMVQGLAVDAYKILADKAVQIDSAKFKNQAIQANFYLVQYYNDIKKDKQAAVSYIDKVLAIDPANADAARIRDILTKPPSRPPTKPKTTGTGTSKPKSGTPAPAPKKPAPVKKK
ncbi:MAG TPA: tetratricopeptide repeat protein [Flavitalea sp.]|nr:tetratricopeptide repeat protein [Flavitalea sp.]